MAVRIDRKLNLVVPVTREDGAKVFVHSTPVSRAVFETYFDVLATAFGRIWNMGNAAVVSGPRIGALVIRSVATERGTWEGPAGVRLGLMEEIGRLTNVLVPASAGGWELLTLHDAARRGAITDDDASEVENVVCFFTVNLHMHRREMLATTLDLMNDLWGTSLTSCDPMAYAATLPTSTPAAPSTSPTREPTAAASSVPH